MSRRRNRRNLWRVTGWGSSAAIALAAVAFVSQTETGGERLELAFGGSAAPPASIAEAPKPETPAVAVVATPPAAPPDPETRLLAIQLRDLTADRDRLAARLASLEQHLTDVTGSIERQRAAAVPTETATPVRSPAGVAAATAPDPAVAAPAAVATAPDVLPTIAAIAVPPSDPPRLIEPLAMPAAQPNPAQWTDAPNPERPPTPPITASVPMPPARTAAAPAAERPPAPRRLEFAVDIGGSLSADGLAGQWAAVKANFGPILTGLRPAIGRDRRFGRAPYRLLIGPLPSAAAAARLCARLSASGVECRATRFEGEQLAQFRSPA